MTPKAGEIQIRLLFSCLAGLREKLYTIDKTCQAGGKNG